MKLSPSAHPAFSNCSFRNLTIGAAQTTRGKISNGGPKTTRQIPSLHEAIQSDCPQALHFPHRRMIAEREIEQKNNMATERRLPQFHNANSRASNRKWRNETGEIPKTLNPARSLKVRFLSWRAHEGDANEAGKRQIWIGDSYFGGSSGSSPRTPSPFCRRRRRERGRKPPAGAPRPSSLSLSVSLLLCSGQLAGPKFAIWRVFR